MNTLVLRTCTELGDDVSGGALGLLPADGRPLDGFRSTPAYVLLGDPGAGKTTEFDRESRESTELGDAALMLSAKDFIELDLGSHPEWRDRILFIDGLDEMRAGRDDSSVPLGEIRNRLDRLRPPGFRISCREADWLGHSDRRSIEAVSPDSPITVLRLDELDDRQVTELLLHQHERTDPQEFIDRARQHGVGGLLVNPLTLRLLVDAVRHGGDWPDSRRRTLEMACRQIAAEHNQEHRVATRPPPLETLVDAAGWLCARQLLSGIEGYVPPSGVTAHSFVSLTELGEPPASLSRSDLEHALTTKLFRATGDGFVPLHRHVAEFLAGRCLAKLIAGGLPARRVVSLMTGKTGDRVVTSLRGLSAWLAAHSREARPQLIDADPVGVGLYGDIGDLTPHEKEQLLECLSVFAGEAYVLGHQRQDGCNHGYRDDTAWAFRGLATADMVPAIRERGTMWRCCLSPPSGRRSIANPFWWSAPMSVQETSHTSWKWSKARASMRGCGACEFGPRISSNCTCRPRCCVYMLRIPAPVLRIAADVLCIYVADTRPAVVYICCRYTPRAVYICCRYTPSSCVYMLPTHTQSCVYMLQIHAQILEAGVPTDARRQSAN